MNDLRRQEGILYPLLRQVKADHTLMLAIRKDYINIYYRGGNILKGTERSKKYGTYFDKNYNISKKEIPNSPTAIKSQSDSEKWVKSFAQRKNKRLWWIFLAQVYHWTTHSLWTVVFSSLFYPLKAVLDYWFIPIMSVLLPVMVMEAVAGAYLGYQIYQRVKKVQS